MREKVSRLEKDMDEVVDASKKDSDRFVTHQHLSAVIDPMRRTLEMVQKDVKEILHVVGSVYCPKDHPKDYPKE